jgi:hypothetical protein
VRCRGEWTEGSEDGGEVGGSAGEGQVSEEETGGGEDLVFRLMKGG